ncbi:acetyl-CoA carboxylase biotin carboxylase subunit [Pseudoclavibacter endophyticus]|uniref:biotin carboxylase n=1 Tax=Pseudoclavibacter endophyticus TaxID=1778590 RepID=A0A6H9WFB9_9MICO|nr:acetyl-CoA carboxylase biotin carboxylase subunit [Pseudoclavibacter endophyticus]KAB1649649.1 acetyl-CoA carboxylase biotin carboxylase subunit [Pseudoclavibacter endophyticus]
MAISRVLIANRGEIAVRVIRACQELGIETVAVVSEADRESLAATLADRTIAIGPAPPSESYLRVPTIVTAAVATGADAIHPGYGFLAENPELADACREAGVTLVGPTAEHMRLMGDKLTARRLARDAGVPVLAGSEKIATASEAAEIADRVGLPVMMKASAGGGGRGMKIVRERDHLADAFTAASAEARSAFGDSTLYVERYISNARHIEVQVVGDSHGNVVHLGDRDCSVQRRHQKVIEEAPAFRVPEEVRASMRDSAVLLAGNIGYVGAGTVEFIYDEDAKQYFFLEMNTRIQVEHPISEMITGIDLIQEQFRVADGLELSFAQNEVVFRGHAIECRVTAEIPEQDFRPNAGEIDVWRPPAGPNIRVDTHCFEGYVVPIYYDSLLAKLIVYAPDRARAITRMVSALQRFQVQGIETSIPFLHYVMGSDQFGVGAVNTGLVEELLPNFIAPERATLAS